MYSFEKQNLILNVLYFKDIHDVEFEVRTGPFPGDNQRCKLTCVKGQWVGPLCRTKESKKPLHTHRLNGEICSKYVQGVLA